MPKDKKAKPKLVEGIKHDDKKRSGFGRRLFLLRKAKGITLKRFGNKIGLSTKMIEDYENNTQSPPAMILERMATVLKVTPAYLLGINQSKQRLGLNDDYQ